MSGSAAAGRARESTAGLPVALPNSEKKPCAGLLLGVKQILEAK